MYQGTSLWIWAVQGFVWLCVAALVVAIGLALLVGAALVGLGWLAWQGWLALRDRRDPPARDERPPSISGAPRTKGLVIPRYPIRPYASETVEGSGSDSEGGRNFA